jgi:hypothetical protein
MKKKIKIPMSNSYELIVTMLILVFFYDCGKTDNDMPIVGCVYDEPITDKELIQRMQSNAAFVYSYFYQKYGVSDNPLFWKSKYGGEMPIDMVREKSMEDLKRIKAVLVLAKQYGLVKNISYNDLLLRLDSINKKRGDIVEQGGVIYGPVKYGKEEFLSMTISNLDAKLCNLLSKKGLWRSMDFDGQDKIELEVRYNRKQYESYVDKTVANARISVNKSALCKIELR